MKKSKYLILLLALTLVGCNNSEPSSSETNSSDSVQSSEVSSNTSEDKSTSDNQESSENDETSSENAESSENTSSETEDSSSSTDTTPVLTDIAAIKAYADDFKTKVNEVGIYNSEIKAELTNVQLMTVIDKRAHKEVYGLEDYGAVFSDGTDYLYTQINSNSYSYLKKYWDARGIYNIHGTVSYQNGNIELKVKDKPEWKEGLTKDIDYSAMAEEITIPELYTEAKKLITNIKGNAYGKLVKIKGKCLAEDLGNSNIIFGKDDSIFQVHGSDKVSNLVNPDGNYEVVGFITKDLFRPGLEKVEIKPISDEILIADATKTMTAKEFYNYKYEKDYKDYHPTEEKYSDYYQYAYKVRGYFTDYGTNDYNFVLSPVYNGGNSYAKYENARDKYCLFPRNEDLRHNDRLDEELYNTAYNKDVLIEFTVYPYLWNTNKYPMVYFASWTVVE